ncbi:hypothetical protein Metvu_0668 [Methanocaldococcus vulcanius M7]|uniref:Uncharacterized protein n=1 Tax=Methanocaldococcus vulcanius (strain ATCC 700851 / DSM 12094 / M7) TaxID=579137 RepID=C9RG25_METVM|nr:hypothetical protein [Methanocaldococcus vulcanius]ACX72527.1 hypothetical protein Metvu_0668 [Methanocaldococcus vulcanius M7]
MSKNLLNIKNVGIFTIIGMIFGALFGYFCMVYYLLFIDPYLKIPNKFYPLKSSTLFLFIFLMIFLFGFFGACLDGNPKTIKEFKISTISIIVGIFIYSIILLIIILVSGDALSTYISYKNQGVLWIGGIIVILCSYFLIKKYLFKVSW